MGFVNPNRCGITLEKSTKKDLQQEVICVILTLVQTDSPLRAAGQTRKNVYEERRI